MRSGNQIEISIIEDMLRKNEDAGVKNNLLIAAHGVLNLYLEKLNSGLV